MHDKTAPERVPIVGIGASAGGIKALTALFGGIPAEIGAAFVVIVHLDPTARSELPNILAQHSHLSVSQVMGSAELKPNCIYVIAPDRQLQITDHEISAVPFTEPRGRRAPVDLFFRSLAAQHGDAFAIILSGAGSDGAAGVAAVKEGGGIVLVQSPDEAEYPSMPRSAIATEAADFVLPIRDLTARLVDLVGLRRQNALSADKVDDDEQLRRIIAYLRVRTGHDFALYKRSTIIRRVVRRMQVTGRENMAEYQRFLRQNAEEPQALLSDLLISVTNFFRDPVAFEALNREVIKKLFSGRTDGAPMRVWVPGCATGEEAYSIAMLLLEDSSHHDTGTELQIFASDMDARGLSIAREGRYPVAIEADLTEERLRRFFIRDGEHYRVKRELRDAVLFAAHSILKDPPFSRVDLISCRNLLIYLDRDLQQQVLSTLHYALNPEGYLFLGSSESAEQPTGLFRVVDREARIYQSTGRSPEHALAMPRMYVPTGGSGIPGSAPAPMGPKAAAAAHREALETAAPPSILVDPNFAAVHLSENAGRYLLPSGGQITSDVAELARPELRFELRAALHRAFERGERTLTGLIPVRFNGKPVRVYMQIKPLVDAENRPKQALVVFMEGEENEDITLEGGAPEQPSGKALLQLRHELELAQSRLRTMREESEAANEELRAANEELQSINEEYRSTAEELETSREELQSINEELQTVNSELKFKLDNVSRANSDLQNLMAATDLAILFLDTELRIKRFTPQLGDLFNIMPTDLGRSITDFTHQLDYDALQSDAMRVMEQLVPIERELRSRDGGWFLVRLRPYRTTENRIDGVVVTFLDVSERQEMIASLRESRAKFEQEMRLVDQSLSPIFIWDFDTGAITQWNRGCVRLYGFEKPAAIGHKPETLLKTRPRDATFKTIRDALARDGFWSGVLEQTNNAAKTIMVDVTLELIAAEGRRYVLDMERQSA